jgi:hypothetical protein
MHEPTNISAIVISRLAPHLGPNVARMAMKTSSQKALGLPPEAAERMHVPKLLDAIRPMLNVMLGKDHAETIILEIRRDLG